MSVSTLLATLMLASSPFEVDVAVGAGGTSNAFELPADSVAASADQPQPGVFVPVDAGAAVHSPRRRTFRIGAEGRFGGEFFALVRQDPAATRATSPGDANTWAGRLGIPVVIDPTPDRRDGMRVDFTLEPFASAYRRTYTSHRTGRPLVINGVDLRHRYSNDKFGMKADADLSIGKTFDVVVGGRLTRAEYVDDYRQTTVYDSWDYDETRLDVDGYARPGDWMFAVGYTRRLRDYDERFPRDANGDRLPASDPAYRPQQFTYDDVKFRGGWVTRRGRALLAYAITRRIDHFAGYLDYVQHDVSADLRLTIRETAELRVKPGYSILGYDAARVNYDPSAPENERRRATLEAAFEWPLRTRTRGFVEFEAIDQVSANPLFTYRAARGITGVRVTWR